MIQARDYDSTLARMAGNIAAGLVASPAYQTPTGRVNVEQIRQDAMRVAVSLVKACRELAKQEAIDQFGVDSVK